MSNRTPHDVHSHHGPHAAKNSGAQPTSPTILLQRFLFGELIDSEVRDWLTQGFTAWWRSGGTVPLTTCLHLPATSAGCARVARDAWLRAAADTLPARSRASLLAKEINRFREAPQPSLTHQYLAFAAACGVALPGTVRQVRNILSETPPGFDFRSLQSVARDSLMHADADKSEPPQTAVRRSLFTVVDGGRQRVANETGGGKTEDSQRLA